MARSPIRTYRNAFANEAAPAEEASEGQVTLDSGGDFTAREVTNLMGRRVIAREGLMVPYGTRGNITDSRRYTSGWLMFITWDNLANGTGDWLTKREAVHHLKW